LVKADEGLTDEEIAEELEVGRATVERVRRRSVEEGLAGAQPQEARQSLTSAEALAVTVEPTPSDRDDGAGRYDLEGAARERSKRAQSSGSRYRPWAELLKRTFGIDVETCPRCGGRMRLLALFTDPPNVARFLRHLGEPTDPPTRAPARDPPFWQSRVLRRRHEERSAQRDLFEEH
jgi:transposase